MEENAESKELQIRKLEATVKSLSEELIKVCQFVCLCSKLSFYPLSSSPWALEHRIFAISSRQRSLMLFRDLLEPLAQFGVTASSASSVSTGTTAALTFHILGSWQCIGSSV